MFERAAWTRTIDQSKLRRYTVVIKFISLCIWLIGLGVQVEDILDVDFTFTG